MNVKEGTTLVLTWFFDSKISHNAVIYSSVRLL